MTLITQNDDQINKTLTQFIHLLTVVSKERPNDVEFESAFKSLQSVLNSILDWLVNPDNISSHHPKIDS